jgi:signal transduction histidine kinase
VASVLDSTGALYRTEDLPLTRVALGGEAVTAQELRIRRRDGMELIAEGVATPVPAVDGTRIGAVLTLHDVTARRELERQKEEFFANASHDLRTPVATIKGAIEVVLQNEPPGIPEPLRRMLVIIDHEAERMATLVDDLLELTRLEAGRVQLRLARCDLRAIARRAACAIEPLTHRLGQRVAVEVPKRPLPALVDGERLERALLNLLANAHKYAYEGATICLSLQRRAGEAVLAVADDGPGITPEDQARVFERFYRPTTAATRRNKGSGLGLPIAKAMVELHGGRIWVESGPGKGATFLIALPVGGPMAPGNGARR